MNSSNLLKVSLSNKSVVERIVDQITGAIISGELQPGSKIPTETELCKNLGVGRNSIREAINILKAYGLLYIKKSEGTFVANNFRKSMLDPVIYGLILQKDSISEVMQLREVFDNGIMHMAVEISTKKDLQKLEEAFITLKESILDKNSKIDDILEEDINFHKALFSIPNNNLLNTISEYIDRITIPSRVKAMEKIMNDKEENKFIELHFKILNVIREKKTDLINRTIKEHYQFWENVIKN